MKMQNQQAQVIQSELAKNKDHIQLDGINKIKELEIEDRYKVLEYLVMQLIDIKGHPRMNNYMAEGSE